MVPAAGAMEENLLDLSKHHRAAARCVPPSRASLYALSAHIVLQKDKLTLSFRGQIGASPKDTPTGGWFWDHGTPLRL